MTAVELDSSALKNFVAFTGRLACMTRAEAFEVVREHGGMPSQAVTREDETAHRWRARLAFAGGWSSV